MSPEWTKRLAYASRLNQKNKDMLLRVANDTGNVINQGYVVNDGEMYFETQEALLNYLRSIDPSIADMSDDFILKDGYDAEVYYWTEWLDEN